MAHEKEKDAELKERLDPFLVISLVELQEWAGMTIFDRGCSYQSRGAVQDLKRTEDGVLVASVEGTRRYTTCVFIQGEKMLESDCTCPYWTTCKHAVAVVVEYRQCVRAGVDVRQGDFEDSPETEISATDSKIYAKPPIRKGSVKKSKLGRATF